MIDSPMDPINPANNGTVMIVDDTPGNLAVLSDTLSEANYRVLVATDGYSALEQIQYLKPDIILLDVLMPGIDGFDTCRKIKANPETSEIPVLFMTGVSELDYLLRGFGEGALDYIVKPIRPPEVLARVEVHLNLTRNIQRAHFILNYGVFSALTVDSAGAIKWLTPAAKDWITDFQQSSPDPQTPDIGDLIPVPLLDWFKNRLLNANISKTDSDFSVQYRSGNGFSVKMTRCHQPGEYLLLLQKEQPAWDVNTFRSNLNLTFREAEILMWIARGKTNKEVGIILGSSPRTVNKHMEHIFEKLGVATRSAAVAMALKS